ncbi:histidine phosphatase superfamily [Apiospora hydei]|uniref:Histidine phosphatase superfamily n=1 Tax=Apiospora hydei TaxID=1337664 RepID=A0ABR1VGX6_9PEZI
MSVKRLRSLIKRVVKHTFQSRPKLTINTATPDCEAPLGMSRRYKFTTVQEIFVDYTKDGQNSSSSPTTIATYDQLGIIEEKDYDQDRKPSPAFSSQWKRLEDHIAKLNRECDNHESYKVIYVVRHGRGVHNVVMDAVGSKWKEKWALVDGARLDELPEMPELPAGREQARELARDWVKWNRENGMPIPGTIYTSPMVRCLETTELIYGDVLRENGRNIQPVIKENLRERLTNHTCDRRRTRSSIEKNFPKFYFEPGFKEEDTLWRARSTDGSTTAETDDEHTARKQRLLEDIFDTDNSHFISLTTHSYAISGILASVGSPPLRVKEGSMLAMLIKAEKELPPMNGNSSGGGTTKHS